MTKKLRRDEKQEVISISASHGLVVDVGRLPIIRPSGQRAIARNGLGAKSKDIWLRSEAFDCV